MEQIKNYFAIPGIIKEYKSKEGKIEALLCSICKHFLITREQLMSKSRLREYVEPRQIAMYIISDVYGLGCSKTSRIFNKNHATVLYASRVVHDLMSVDKDFKNLVRKFVVL